MGGNAKYKTIFLLLKYFPNPLFEGCDERTRHCQGQLYLKPFLKFGKLGNKWDIFGKWNFGI